MSYKIIITDLKERRQYDGNALKESGTGGGITCAIYLAEELAKLGHTVTICNRRTNLTKVNDVFYVSREWAARAEFDIWINSRTPHAFQDGDIKAKKKILWLHDLYLKGLETLWKECDVIVPVSKWHSEWLDRIYHWKGNVECNWIHNGCDIDKFENAVDLPKDDNIIYNIWTPIAKKGLDAFLGLYDDLRVEISEKTGKTLHTDIFGSYEAWGYTVNENRAQSNGLYDRLAAGEFKGVTYHGSVDQFVLAKYYKRADTFLFPSDFKETFCINALDAMASKTAIVYHDCGALPEVVGNCGVMVGGKMRDKAGVLMSYKDRFINAATSIIDEQTAPFYGRVVKHLAYERAKTLTWTKIAKQWEDLFLRLLPQ